MLSDSTVNEGTCFVCHQTIPAEQTLAHLQICGGQVAVTPAVERVWQVKVATGDDYWIFIEAAGSVTIQDLYLFLRNNWWECCGHASEFIIEGANLAENYLMKTLNDMFVIGTTFHYQHDSGEPTKVVGEVIAVKSMVPVKKLSVLLRKNIIMESCESCMQVSH